MLIRIFLLLLLLASSAAFAQAQPKTRLTRPVEVVPVPAQPLYEVRYSLTPRWEGPSRHFLVEAGFQAGPGEETLVELPDSFGAARELHANIRNLESLDAQVQIKPGPAAKQRMLVHPPNHPVRLRYEVHHKVRERLDHTNFYDPLLEAEWFQLFGHAAFLYPAYLDKGLVNVTLEWREVPESWTLAGSHGIKSGARTVWTKSRVPLAQVRHAVYVGGDFRMHEVRIHGQPIHFALRGAWAFQDSEFVESTRKLMAAHRDFWDDHDFPHYLITLIPNAFKSGSSGGTAIHNAFSMHASADFKIPGPTFDFLIGHEHLHSWVPGKIGPMGEDEATRYWFSEGFTNYLTHRLLVKSGLWTRERYAEAINEVITKYLMSPALKFDNRTTADNFWKRQDAGELPYQRGELLALRWHSRLAPKGDSLDRLLKTLRKTEADGELATTRLSKALARLLPGVGSDISQFIERGEVAEFLPDLLGPCYEKRDVVMQQFEAGFNVSESLKTRTMTGVVPDSAAWRAGLRDGQKIRALSINDGDIKNDVRITVESPGGQQQKLDYRPVKPGKAPVPQYFVKAEADKDAACLAWF